MPSEIVALVLAGGKGERLYPLTKDRAKPAVPFGGMYRIIDFTLSNCVNSGIKRILVLSQYKSNSLIRHIQIGWLPFFATPMGEFIYSIPAQQRIGASWYEGTADAVFQNLYSLQQVMPKYTLILSGDHIYQMNYRKMLEHHIRLGADLTIGTVNMPVEVADQFGVLKMGADYVLEDFQEKPKVNPFTLPEDPGQVSISMGIYIFNTQVLIKKLIEDAKDRDSSHDFGKNVIPHMLKENKVVAYPFQDVNGGSYWRDIGTLDAYYAANLDLVAITPQCNLYNTGWPVHTVYSPYPPAKMVFSGGEDGARVGQVLDSIVCGGSVISGGRVKGSIVSPNARVNSYAEIVDTILFEGVEVGRGAKIKGAIVEKGVQIPAGTIIGYDAEADRRRFDVSPGGVVAVPCNAVFD